MAYKGSGQGGQFCASMAPHLIGSCNPVVVQGPLTRVIPSSTDWRYTRQIANITTRSEEVEQRTRCGEVVQRGKGVWLHPAPVGRGRIRPFLGDSDGWLQIADGGTNGGVRGQTGAERLPGRERYRTLEAQVHRSMIEAALLADRRA